MNSSAFRCDHLLNTDNELIQGLFTGRLCVPRVFLHYAEHPDLLPSLYEVQCLSNDASPGDIFSILLSPMYPGPVLPS